MLQFRLCGLNMAPDNVQNKQTDKNGIDHRIPNRMPLAQSMNAHVDVTKPAEQQNRSGNGDIERVGVGRHK